MLVGGRDRRREWRKEKGARKGEIRSKKGGGRKKGRK